MELYNVKDMLNKEITLDGKDYLLDNYEVIKNIYEIEILVFRLKLKDGKEEVTHNIPTSFFFNGRATSNDSQLNEFLNTIQKDYEDSIKKYQEKELIKKEQAKLDKESKEKEELIKKQEEEVRQKELGLQRGKEDARKKASLLYNIFKSSKYKDIEKSNNYHPSFRSNYITSYEEEKCRMKQEKDFQHRANQRVLETYPGDLDELINWMRENLLRIEVYASPDKLETEQQKYIDKINKRDNTNYKVKVRQGLYVAYEAYFKNPTTAPKEFLTWKVSKHDYTTSDLNKRVMSTPMDISTGKMTCNSIIKELVYSDEYKFPVGNKH